MAARRDRERRRPSTESRYRFATPESVVQADDVADGGDTTLAREQAAERQVRGRRATTPDSRQTAASARGSSRPAPLPFTAYASEYAYVLKDLRRVGLVIGSLLVFLILLNFVLPH